MCHRLILRRRETPSGVRDGDAFEAFLVRCTHGQSRLPQKWLMSEQWRKLRPGDRVRLLSIPKSDLEQRAREQRDGVELAGWTADTLERILKISPVVTIDRVDEFGAPWFDCKVETNNGEIEFHSLTITDDESWERLTD